MLLRLERVGQGKLDWVPGSSKFRGSAVSNMEYLIKIFPLLKTYKILFNTAVLPRNLLDPKNVLQKQNNAVTPGTSKSFFSFPDWPDVSIQTAVEFFICYLLILYELS